MATPEWKQAIRDVVGQKLDAYAQKIEAAREEGFDFYMPAADKRYQQVEQQQTDRPAPPPMEPNVETPVRNLKRETAQQYPYTEDARKDLMQTPTRYNTGYPRENKFGEYQSKGSPPPAAFKDWKEWAPGGDINVNRGVSLPQETAERANNNDITLDNPDPAKTLGHEFAHKRYFEDLPGITRSRWGAAYKDIMGDEFQPTMAEYWKGDAPKPTARDRMNTLANTMANGPEYNREPMEAYAEYAVRKPEETPEEFYPNLYRR